MKFSISQEEQKQDNLDSKSLEKAVEQFKEEGYIIIEDALPLELIHDLYSEYTKALNDKVNRFKLERAEPTDERQKYNNNVGLDFQPAGGNHDLNRWNMHIPSRLPFINTQVIAHPKITSIINQILGEDCFMYLIASDTPFPGAGFQTVHQDAHRLALTINIPLVDFHENNAPIEIWPGTHKYPSEDGTISSYSEKNFSLSDEQLKQIVATLPSKRVLLKAGSILIRDQRLVHRGTAHWGDTPRPCLSLWVKSRRGFDIMSLNTPIPHRFLCNWFAKLALKMREQGRGSSTCIQNQKLLNWGNFMGRVVDEISGTDRDYRRVIPSDIWRNLSPNAKNLLRYAEVENEKATELDHKRSILGTLILAAIMVVAITVWIKLLILKK